jgi:hypothetical protein
MKWRRFILITLDIVLFRRIIFWNYWILKNIDFFVHKLLPDGMDIPNLHIKLIRFENKKDANSPQFAITQKASGDDSNLLVLGSDNNIIGDSGTTRTCDLLLRRQLLYPTELRNP